MSRYRQSSPDFKRSQRVASLLKEELSTLLQREMKNPQLLGVVLTEVVTSDDLRHATIYYTTHNQDQSDWEAVQQGLDKACGFLRGKMGRNVRLKRVPEFHFKRDTALEHGEHIDALLRTLNPGDEDETA